MFFSRACPVHRNLLTSDMFQGSRAQELPKKANNHCKMDGILRLEYLLLCNRMAHEVNFLGGKPKWHFVKAPRLETWWRMGRTQRKPKNHTAKPRKATADACLGLESLNIWSSGCLGWFVRNTIFGHVNLTVSCHIKRQLSGTCHVLFLLPGTGIQ